MLDLPELPADAVSRLAVLGEIAAAVQAQIEQEFAEAYFDARLQGHLDEALALGLHGRKTVLAMTRAQNEAKGRMVRWGDVYAKN